MEKLDTKYLIGCCGLNCGLCSKYQSTAPSRCIGCILGEQHSWCSIWNCCVKKHGFSNCTECKDLFNCTIHLRRKVSEWIPAADNLRRIKKNGFERWLKEQEEREAIVELLLKRYNEGRSMNFYCNCSARMPVELLNEVIRNVEEIFERKKVDKSNLKLRAKIVKELLKMPLKMNSHLH